jgi:uncharacterized protein YqgC (DUF456 family)
MLLVDLPLWLAFVAALVLCWGLTLFGLPGNWLIVILAAAVTLVAPEDSRLALAPASVGVLLVLAIAGEVVEFAAGSVSTRRAGGTRRGAALAIVGALVGAVAGAAIGLPIPLIGSLVAAIVCGGVGAMIGAMIGESHAGKDLAASWRVGQAAFWGRLLGTLSKTAIGVVMVVVAAIAAST